MNHQSSRHIKRTADQNLTMSMSMSMNMRRLLCESNIGRHNTVLYWCMILTVGTSCNQDKQALPTGVSVGAPSSRYFWVTIVLYIASSTYLPTYLDVSAFAFAFAFAFQRFVSTGVIVAIQRRRSCCCCYLSVAIIATLTPIVFHKQFSGTMARRLTHMEQPARHSPANRPRGRSERP